MTTINDEYYDDMQFVDYEFNTVPYELFQRQLPGFPPGGPGQFIPPQGGSGPVIPPTKGPHQNPKAPVGGPVPIIPGGQLPPPPPGELNTSGMPQMPPPNYMPSKNDKGVQNFNSQGPNTKAVSPNSIKICLYKYTYIWEVNGRSYWAFLVNIDKVSVSGFRWFGRNWVYFGLALKRIDSFICYSSPYGYNRDDIYDISENFSPYETIKEEFSAEGTRDVYTQTIAAIDIPENKEDFITQTVAYVDDDKITSEIPCMKTRNVGYRINLEVSYPNEYEDELKNNINNIASECMSYAYRVISSTRGDNRSDTLLDTFNDSLSNIPELIQIFSNSFTSKMANLNIPDDNINYSIRKEKIVDNWKATSYNTLI